jgi:hypothetical protein
MSTNDDCYIGAYNLMEFKRSDVSNENTAKSIVLHFRNKTRASSNDRLSQREVDATESINRNSNRFHLGTASIIKDPLRDKSNCCLIKYAGTLTLEAVDALHSNFAVNKKCMKYKSILGEYPRCYRGLGKCHLRALYSVLPQAAKLTLSKKLKHQEASMIQECFNSSKVPRKEKCFNYVECIGFPYVDCFMLTMPIAGM